MDDFNKPNLVFDLAASYDTRFPKARTQSYTSGKDQRKVNCYYDVVRNPVSGRTTLELVKRPGLDTTSFNFNTTTGAPYVCCNVAAESNNTWALTYTGASNTTVATSSAGSATLVTGGGGGVDNYVPHYLDKTLISGTPFGVAQLTQITSPWGQRAFYASAIGSWTEITDGDFPTATRGKIEHLDGFAFILATNNRIHNSDINSLSSWQANNYITKQVQGDKALGLAKFKNQILAFGAETCEVFVNAGNESGSPLKSVPSLAARVGLNRSVDPEFLTGTNTAGHYYTVLGNKLWFVGKGGLNEFASSLYSYDGATFEKISSGPADRLLAETHITSVNSLNFFGNEAIVLRTMFADFTEANWLLYFPRINEWFEWTPSGGVLPMNDGRNFLVNSSGVKAAYFNMAATYPWTDRQITYQMLVQFRLPKNGNNRDFMAWCGLESDTAIVDGSTPSVINMACSFSDDDYSSFSTARDIDISSSAGQKRILRCGSYKHRVVRLTNSDNCEVRMRKFIARVQ